MYCGTVLKRKEYDQIDSVMIIQEKSMKKVIALILLTSLVLVMAACGSKPEEGVKEAEKPVDISNMSEVMFESDALKVTFLDAKLDKLETGLFCDYYFTFQIENKSEKDLIAFIYTPNFGVNGMLCSS